MGGGLVMPTRVAQTFGAVAATAWFQRNGGDPGQALHTQLPGMDGMGVKIYPGSGLRLPMWGSTLARIGAPGFGHLPDHSCWTSSDENVIYYLNTYMNEERLYPDALYEAEYDSPVIRSTFSWEDDLVPTA